MTDATAQSPAPIQHVKTPDLVCPGCGDVIKNPWDFEGDDGIVCCWKCGATYDYVREVEITYTTTLKRKNELRSPQ
jgi:hypothetical protein